MSRGRLGPGDVSPEGVDRSRGRVGSGGRAGGDAVDVEDLFADTRAAAVRVVGDGQEVPGVEAHRGRQGAGGVVSARHAPQPTVDRRSLHAQEGHVPSVRAADPDDRAVGVGVDVGPGRDRQRVVRAEPGPDVGLHVAGDAVDLDRIARVAGDPAGAAEERGRVAVPRRIDGARAGSLVEAPEAEQPGAERSPTSCAQVAPQAPQLPASVVVASQVMGTTTPTTRSPFAPAPIVCEKLSPLTPVPVALTSMATPPAPAALRGASSALAVTASA